VPVFSLRTNKSFGTGDFSDLKTFIDWAAMNHMKMIQILPVNDTISTFSFLDSYPYKSISVFALHPIYLDIFKLGKLKDKKQKTYFERLQKELNANQLVNYEKVVDAKMQFFRVFLKENQEQLLEDVDYIQFFKANKEWLISYAAFSVLRDKYRTSDFSKWESLKSIKKPKFKS
jgi:4-alpha-glucanotransferase